MSKYFTRRCIWLHVVTLLLVSSFLVAAVWQYDCAIGGNGLSWAYVFEWPAFAIYAVYMWWRLIHDQRTAFDRLWASKQHAAADAAGTPLYQIPGWALDKSLSRAVVAASLEAGDAPAPSLARAPLFVPPALGDGRIPEPSPMARQHMDGRTDDKPYEGSGGAGGVIDAEVTDVKVNVDEDLKAYNRYLAELNWKDAPKHWGSRRFWRRRDGGGSEPVDAQRGELPVGERHADAEAAPNADSDVSRL